MFRFYLKKNLCDVWDNLFHIFVVNCVTNAVIILGVFLCVFGKTLGDETSIPEIYIFAALIISCMLAGVFIFAEGDNAAKVADFETPTFRLYFGSLAGSIKDGVLFGLFIALLVSIAFVTIPYYFHVWIPEDGSQGSWMGLLLLSLVFWFIVITVLALQWFIPVRALMHNNFLKCLKKCYILFFDNAGFTIAMGINNLLIIVLSCVMLGFIPGISALTIMNTNALRLRLYKYDWLEVNPDLSKEEKKHVPWDQLLAKDKKTLGPRKFKSFLFPWKE